MAPAVIGMGAKAALRICLASGTTSCEWEPGERRKRSESTGNGEESNMNSKRRRMSDYAWILVLVGWLVLMKFVLPRFGVFT
jgi:predicted nucleic acid-binding Zn ribbon protein